MDTLARYWMNLKLCTHRCWSMAKTWLQLFRTPALLSQFHQTQRISLSSNYPPSSSLAISSLQSSCTLRAVRTPAQPVCAWPSRTSQSRLGQSQVSVLSRRLMTKTTRWANPLQPVKHSENTYNNNTYHYKHSQIEYGYFDCDSSGRLVILLTQCINF